MGLGSLVDLSPTVMENDYHYATRKEEEIAGGEDEDRRMQFVQLNTPSPSPPLENGRAEKKGTVYSPESSGAADIVHFESLKKHFASEDCDEQVKINGSCGADHLHVVSQTDGTDAEFPKSAVAVGEHLNSGEATISRGNDNFNRSSVDREIRAITDRIINNINEIESIETLETPAGQSFSPLSVSVSFASLDETVAQNVFEAADTVLTSAESLSSGAVRNQLASSSVFVSPRPRYTLDGADDGLALPNEQTLNKALEFFRRPDSGLSADSSALPSPSSRKTSSCASPSRKKEVAKRKTMQERLNKLRDRNALVINIPEFEQTNTTQLAILLRRFKKQLPVAEYLSEEVIQHVLSNQRVYDSLNYELERERSSADLSARLRLRSFRMVTDPDATESSSDEETEPTPSTSSASACIHISHNLGSFRHLREQVEIAARDMRAAHLEEECKRQLDITRQQLAELRKRKEAALLDTAENTEASAARCLQFNWRIRRKLARNSERRTDPGDVAAQSLDGRERVRAYSLIESRIHPEFSGLSCVPLERCMQTYIRRRSTRPETSIRKRWDRSPWMSRLADARAISDEAVSGEERKKRKRDAIEKMEGEEDFTLSSLHRPRRSNYHSKAPVSPLKRAGKRLVKRSLDRKRNGDRRGRSRRQRHSFGEGGARASSCGLEVDEAFQDFTLLGLPQKIDYKEICIPKWKHVPIEGLAEKTEWPCSHLAESSTTAEVSRRHLPLELSERKRFQQYRDFVASKAAGTATSKLSGSAQSKLSGAHSKLSGAQSKLSGTHSKLSGKGGGSARSSSSASVGSGCSSMASSPATPLFSLEDEQSNSLLDSAAVPDYDRPSAVKPFSTRVFPIPSSVIHGSL